jgi:1-deoxy-D-xylulose-5-phosphate reductoisomerase
MNLEYQGYVAGPIDFDADAVARRVGLGEVGEIAAGSLDGAAPAFGLAREELARLHEVEGLRNEAALLDLLGHLVSAVLDDLGGDPLDRLRPIDSEHSAIWQCLVGERLAEVKRLVLTASGGPFRGRDASALASVTREEALAHPTWRMGGKITVDSATLMNKGLELIEAHHLFGVPYDRMDVVVHPQSIVHALVHLNDGATLAHLGYPDMRVPISYALHHPDRADVPVPTLDLVELGELTFEAPDEATFACLRLAREAAAAGGTAPCVLNAANEVAVHAFLRGELSFTGIARVIESTLSELPARPVRHFSDLYEADGEAREVARGVAA